MKILARILKGGLVCALLFVGGSQTLAYNVESIDQTPNANDFVVGPGKTELRIDPGQTSLKNITITNRYGKEMRFNIEIEDFTSGKNPNEAMSLMGDEKGPYSLRDYIKPEVMSFVLQQGDRASIPVSISIPADATPGGLYGAVIVTTETTDPLEKAQLEAEQAKSGIMIKSRIASLFFVRVNGPVTEDGILSEFKVNKSVFTKGPINFSYSFKNNGSVYLNPYGIIEITNLYGTVVEQISVQPYFVMPNFDRLMSKTWDREFTMGRYKATLKLNRGYGDQVDTKTVTFWVLPWKIIAGILIGLFLLLVIIGAVRKWFKMNFEYKGGKKNETPPPAAPQA